MTTAVLDPEKRELLDLSDDLLERYCSIDHLRACLDSGVAHTDALWNRLAETGLVSALIAEQHGGVELTASHLSGVLFEFGRRAVPEPFLETAVIATAILGAVPGDEAGAWLERIAAGDAIVAIHLDGVSQVAFARDADLLLAIAEDDTVRAYLPGELDIRDLPALDPLRPLARVGLRGDGALLEAAPDAVRRARTLALAGAACLLAGATRSLLDLTVDYVTVRTQFDRPVGSFQAVKHKIADVAVMADMATSAALSAFDGADEPDAWRHAAAAKAYAGDAGALANLHALQLHGGIGFTWEYQLHIWLKRVMSLGAAYGTTSSLRRELARQLLADVAGDRSR